MTKSNGDKRGSNNKDKKVRKGESKHTHTHIHAHPKLREMKKNGGEIRPFHYLTWVEMDGQLEAPKNDNNSQISK